jgi:hypothetical protein
MVLVQSYGVDALFVHICSSTLSSLGGWQTAVGWRQFVMWADDVIKITGVSYQSCCV